MLRASPRLQHAVQAVPTLRTCRRVSVVISCCGHVQFSIRRLVWKVVISNGWIHLGWRSSGTVTRSRGQALRFPVPIDGACDGAQPIATQYTGSLICVLVEYLSGTALYQLVKCGQSHSRSPGGMGQPLLNLGEPMHLVLLTSHVTECWLPMLHVQEMIQDAMTALPGSLCKVVALRSVALQWLRVASGEWLCCH